MFYNSLQQHFRMHAALLEPSERRNVSTKKKPLIFLPLNTVSMSRKSNQYTPIDAHEFVHLLLTTRCKHVVTGSFECLLPTGQGTYPNDAGYIRVNFAGRKVLAHQLVFQTTFGFTPKERGEDTSHRCGNPACCNPDHMVSEPRLENISRRGCMGFLVTADGVIRRVCKHEPTCCVSFSLSEFPVVGHM